MSSLRALLCPVMAESWKTKLLRWRFNRYAAFRRTGARVVAGAMNPPCTAASSHE